MTDLPLLCPEHWPTVERDARELLSVLRAHPRARPPRAVVVMLLDHHREKRIPQTVMEALAIVMEVADYGRAQLRRAALRRGREAGRTTREIATEELGVDPRSLRARPAPASRPKNADLFDLVLDCADRGAPLGNDARLAVAAALGLVGEDGRWRTRVLGDVRRYFRSDRLLDVAPDEALERKRRADALSSRVRDGDIDALREALAEAREAIVEGGGDPSLVDEVTNFELRAREEADHWNALHPHAEHPREPKQVDERRAWEDLILRHAVGRKLRTQVLDAAEVARRCGGEKLWVAARMARPEWEQSVTFRIIEDRLVRKGRMKGRTLDAK